MIVDARDKNIPTKFIGCTITLKLHLAYNFASYNSVLESPLNI